MHVELYKILISFSNVFTLQACEFILDVKKKIAPQYGVTHHSISIVDVEEGIIYGDERPISGLSSPLQVMVGNENRQFPSYLNTEEPDILDDFEDELRLKMSCGHAICKSIPYPGGGGVSIIWYTQTLRTTGMGTFLTSQIYLGSDAIFINLLYQLVDNSSSIFAQVATI
jgi:hypothetical protein